MSHPFTRIIWEPLRERDARMWQEIAPYSLTFKLCIIGAFIAVAACAFLAGKEIGAFIQSTRAVCT
jgi:hypothetical protein